MRPGIAVVGLPGLTEKSLAGTMYGWAQRYSSCRMRPWHNHVYVFRPGAHE
jgi:hypothetical protein